MAYSSSLGHIGISLLANLEILYKIFIRYIYISVFTWSFYCHPVHIHLLIFVKLLNWLCSVSDSVSCCVWHVHCYASPRY